MVLKSIGENVPNDLQWHKKLFEKAFEPSGQRTAIFRRDYKDKLVEYLSFRHFFRHSYGYELDWRRLKPLISDVEELWKMLEDDINKFVKNN